MYEAFNRFLLRHKIRIGIIATGHAFMTISTYGFDFILYPYVIWGVGFFIGFPILTILAAFIDLVTIYIYDKTKKDWLGIEAIKSVEESIVSRPVAKILDWTRNREDIVTAAALSFFLDPLIIMLYLRNGSNQYNWISRRDWNIFLTATVVGNLYWATLVLLGVETAEYLQIVGPS